MSRKPKLKRVLIMAGGTGGHVFPGLSLAHYLYQQQVDVHWLGTSKGLEAQLVPKAAIPLHFINITGIRRNGIIALCAAPFQVTKAIIQALAIIKKVQPDVIVGLGGFVSGPGGIAGWLAKKPLIIHEQNAVAGLTNKILARFAKKVLEAFPHSFPPYFKVITLGNPVRTEIESLPPPKQRQLKKGDTFNLLVLGGSLGAKALNEILPQAIAQMPAGLRPAILHQTGQKLFNGAASVYTSQGIEARVVPFVAEMDEAYAWADIVLCRAGALTVSELCVAGVGAIFVPYPHAVDDHQTANARFMVSQGAAMCMPQSELTVTSLAAVLINFAKLPQKRIAMANAAYQLRKLLVVNRIYQICEEVCR